jgi:PAT family beta-lactamase induction signal transducer AmpG
MVSMVVLGFCSGLPFLLTLSTLNLWLVESGVSKVTVGVLGLLHLPYSLKFVCAPFMDVVRIPFIHSRLGHRRGWAVLSQGALVILIGALAFCDPHQDLGIMMVLAFLVSCAKACQDVVLYACQVEVLDKKQYTAGAACMIAGYRLGMLISGAGAIGLAAAGSWNLSYAVMAALVGVGMVYVLSMKEPASAETQINPLRHLEQAGFNPRASLWRQTVQAFCIPFRLVRRYPWWGGMAFFIFWFKAGDTLSHFMANAFYLELGYSKAEIGTVVKTFGMGASLAGGIMAAFLDRAWGMRKAFVVAGLAHMISILLMILMNHAGYNMPLFYGTIAVENGTNGMAMSLFIAWLYRWSPSPWSAVLYPFLWALHSVSRDVCNAISGWMATEMGWPLFFGFCAFVSLPSLWVFWSVTRDEADPASFLQKLSRQGLATSPGGRH